jgi:hypothetical protein
MKTLLKTIVILALALGLHGLLLGQSKAGDRTKTKKAGGANAPASGADKKTSGEDKVATALAGKSASKDDDSKAKDPLENLKFRNL